MKRFKETSTRENMPSGSTATLPNFAQKGQFESFKHSSEWFTAIVPLFVIFLLFQFCG